MSAVIRIRTYQFIWQAQDHLHLLTVRGGSGWIVTKFSGYELHISDYGHAHELRGHETAQEPPQ